MSIKNNVLKVLEDNKGSSISGESLAKSLNVSRNSIWKAISSLRNDGYNINAITNKGYCLLENNDVISEIGLRKYLSPDFIGDIYVYKTIDSTNRMAKKLTLNEVPNFSLIISEEQTEGKGRLGRNFYSPSNCGIYMSLIIKPTFSFKDALLVTTATSVGICTAIKNLTDIETKIKWVNDIYFDNKKVCGILTEATTNFETGNIDYLILGIGINFISPVKGFPEEIANIATSLFKNSSNGITRNQLAAEIINELHNLIPNISKEKFLSKYKELSIVLNKDIKFISNNTENTGRVLDIDDTGALIVENLDGSKLTLNSGEISIRTI